MNSRAPLSVGRVTFFGRHRGEVNCSAFSPDGQTLLTASEDGYLYGWETKSGQLLWRLGGHTGHQRSVETLIFSPDSRQLASGGWDKQVMLWEVQSGHKLRHLEGHHDSIQSSDFSPNANCLATGSWDSTVRIWDLRVGTPAVFHQELEGHSGNISCLCYSLSGLLGSGSWDKNIHIWKPNTSSLMVQLKGHVAWVNSIAFSPDEGQLASASYSGTIKVWDYNTGKCLETLKVRPVAAAPSEGSRKDFRTWSLVLCFWQGFLDVAHTCAFTRQGKLLVSGAAI
ncbi:WD repeat-containing protein 38 isoform X5 [Marmota marmota marmota]|uniref:WD repeat-containing protein 38 isoform X5 n=1 Tax=Marmota marmota marmota TaxID=9994 RepID=UPI0020939400|nr:WD repeat-containing protein 38 isoform X5 [Marmota marmota marmota]